MVDVVVTDLGLGENRLALELWGCLVERAPRLHGRTTSRHVWSFLVVVEDEAVDLLLSRLDGGDLALLAQVLLQGLVVALDLALRLGMVGLGVLEADAEHREVNL